MALSPAEEDLLGRVAIPTRGSLILPGITYESARVVQHALQENHVKYDWQFTPGGLHNHLSHAVLASYSLGASPELLRDIYKLHSLAQLPMCRLQSVKISFQNWTRWLGNSEFYSSYLAFFTEEIGKYGPTATIERYLFKFKEGKLLIRTVSGAIHPLIQLGHGVEFGLDALVAEGLAQACVHSAMAEPLFPPGWPNAGSSSSTPSSPFAQAFSRFNMKAALPVPRESFSSTALRLDPGRPRHPRVGLSGFTILSHMLRDPRLAAGQANTPNDKSKFGAALKNRGDVIAAWCEEWVVDESGGWTEVVEKAEELFWIATVIVGASSRPGYKNRLDFFLMHALTSVIFLPPLLEVLSPQSRIALLHSHFRVMLGYWISRGRPFLYINEVLMAATPYPQPPYSQPYSRGAISRWLEKGGTEEVEIRNKALREKEDSTSTPEIPSVQEAKQYVAANGLPLEPSPAPQSNGDSSSEVDVPLDSPAEEKEAHLSVPQNGDESIEEDGARTPRVSNSHGRSPSPSEDTWRENKSAAVCWARIIASVVDHSDEHTTKMARSLAYAAQHFGMAPPGVYRSAIPGTEVMDGSIFIRLAGILMEAMGWEHEGEEKGEWDRSCLGFDEAWRDETNENAERYNVTPAKKVDKGKGRAVD